MPLITKLKKYRRKYQRFFWLGCVVLALLLIIPLIIPHPSQAQFVMPQGFSGQGSGYKPPEVSRYGPIEVAPVRSPVDNGFLFDVAPPLCITAKRIPAKFLWSKGLRTLKAN
ncbi:hypothetical protein NON20_06465 [Synechocystis sp. B12]|nr:hypothetical protein NON20_06465 [Synechocystis sp. B12]